MCTCIGDSAIKKIGCVCVCVCVWERGDKYNMKINSVVSVLAGALFSVPLCQEDHTLSSPVGLGAACPLASLLVLSSGGNKLQADWRCHIPPGGGDPGTTDDC